MTYTPSLEIRAAFSPDVLSAVAMCEKLRATDKSGCPSEIVEFVHDMTGVHWAEIWDAWSAVADEREAELTP